MVGAREPLPTNGSTLPFGKTGPLDEVRPVLPAEPRQDV